LATTGEGRRRQRTEQTGEMEDRGNESGDRPEAGKEGRVWRTFVDFLVVGSVDDGRLFQLLLLVSVAASERLHQLLLSVVSLAAALHLQRRALQRGTAATGKRSERGVCVWWRAVLPAVL
jgi:hypothetical protein